MSSFVLPPHLFAPPLSQCLFTVSLHAISLPNLFTPSLHALTRHLAAISARVISTASLLSRLFAAAHRASVSSYLLAISFRRFFTALHAVFSCPSGRLFTSSLFMLSVQDPCVPSASSCSLISRSHSPHAVARAAFSHRPSPHPLFASLSACHFCPVSTSSFCSWPQSLRTVAPRPSFHSSSRRHAASSHPCFSFLRRPFAPSLPHDLCVCRHVSVPLWTGCCRFVRARQRRVLECSLRAAAGGSARAP